MIDLFSADWRAIWQGAEDTDSVGSIFTRPEIVSLILDLAAFSPTRLNLSAKRTLEPSCGDGAFTREIVARVIQSVRGRHSGVVNWRAPELANCIRACDISATAIASAQKATRALLASEGCPSDRAEALATTWIFQTDFLLHDWQDRFDFVVGNPPYVRIEDLPAAVLSSYRSRYETATDRADLYVAFFERGLELLTESGALAFICANRFTKNMYGRRLRKLIATQYHVRYYLNLEHTQPFESDVSAYPAVFVIDRARGKATRAATAVALDTGGLGGLTQRGSGWSRFATWYPSGEAWASTDADEHERLKLLADSFPTLEDSAPGTRVGIGVATGADAAFVLDASVTGVEPATTLPLAMAADLGNDEIRWSGHRLLNPFDAVDDGRLIDLKAYPGAARHIGKHEALLRKRHVAQKREHNWYRTIDRVWPDLVTRPKLLMPDIQTRIVVGYDRGEFYPHHNVYWITSDSWNLLALKTLLRSEQIVSQVRAFSVQMRGGAIRFQAQTLRKVRLPRFADLSEVVVKRLVAAAFSSDQAEINAAADEAFDVPKVA